MTRSVFEYEISIMQVALNSAMRAFAEGEEHLAEKHLEISIVIGKDIVKMFSEQIG